MSSIPRSSIQRSVVGPWTRPVSATLARSQSSNATQMSTKTSDERSLNEGHTASDWRRSCTRSLFQVFLVLLVAAAACGIAYGIFVGVTSRQESIAEPSAPNGPESGPVSVTPTVPQGPLPAGVNMNQIPVYWFDLTCGAASPPATVETNVQKAIAYTNDILERSESLLRLTFGAIRTVTAPTSCLLLGHDTLTINKISQNLTVTDDDSVNHRHAYKVVRIVTGQEAVSGFSVIGSGISFLRLNEYSRIFAQEFGHAFGLVHPFPAPNGTLDLPPVCTTSEAARTALLSRCPIGLRTCRNALVDETVTNIMDMLPEACGRPYSFTSEQVRVLSNWIANKY